MSRADFFGTHARERAARAVKAVEAQTSAEIVISVRPTSGNYRATDYHVGFVALGVVVAYLLVAPQVFSLGQIALEGVGAFVVGALLSANVAPLRRRLVRRATLQKNVEIAGRAAFYELGISRTSGRNGLLVFVSAFERRCVVVPDIGIDLEALGGGYHEACEAMDQAIATLDLEAFAAAVERLGPILEKTMPRAEDDVNELPDEVQ